MERCEEYKVYKVYPGGKVEEADDQVKKLVLSQQKDGSIIIWPRRGYPKNQEFYLSDRPLEELFQLVKEGIPVAVRILDRCGPKVLDYVELWHYGVGINLLEGNPAAFSYPISDAHLTIYSFGIDYKYCATGALGALLHKDDVKPFRRSVKDYLKKKGRVFWVGRDMVAVGGEVWDPILETFRSGTFYRVDVKINYYLYGNPDTDPRVLAKLASNAWTDALDLIRWLREKFKIRRRSLASYHFNQAKFLAEEI